jgi:hypothetical protein
VPSLVAIYVLRRRFQRRDVTALFLWSSLVRAEQGGRRVERFRTPLLFFVELLILLALALAATDLRHLASRPVRPLVLILDNSYSMQATVGERSARDRALAMIREEMERYAPTSVRVILAGDTPLLAGPPMAMADALEVARTRWSCLSPAGNLSAARALAAEVGEADAWVVVATDHPPKEETDAPRLRWLATGRKGANAVFIAATRNHAGGDTDRCFLQIANPGDLAVETRLEVNADGQSLGLGRKLELAPGASEQIAFDLPGRVDTIRATLSPDALATDNEVILLPPRNQRVRVANSVADEELRGLVARALTASGLRDTSPGKPELVISDSATGAPSAGRWTCEIHVPPSALPFTGPFVGDWGHRLLQGLDFGGVVWAGKADATPTGQPVLMAGNTVLIEDRELGGGHGIRMHLDVKLSTVTRTPNWPSLFWNLLHWRAEFHPGFQEAQARMGNTVRLLLPPSRAVGEESGILLQSPDGEKRELAWPLADELVVAAATPGIYSARVGNQTYRFACNALSPAEGDLRHCREARLGGRLAGDMIRREYASGAWLFGLLCCGLVLFHLFLSRPRMKTPGSGT